MSVRDRVEEDLVRRLMDQRGLRVHFSFGDPVVSRSSDGEKLPASDGEAVWEEVKAEAEALYQLVLDRVDWNRIALESWAAWEGARDQGVRVDEFGRDPGATGRAIKAALSTRDTLPDWSRRERL